MVVALDIIGSLPCYVDEWMNSPKFLSKLGTSKSLYYVEWYYHHVLFHHNTAQSEGKGSSSQRLVSSLSTLYLISKIKPQHLVKHAMTLQPYLSTKCSVSTRIVMGSFLLKGNVILSTKILFTCINVEKSWCFLLYPKITQILRRQFIFWWV